MNNYLSWVGIYFTGLFTAYFLSELRPLADRKMTKILSRILLLRIIEYSFGILFPVLQVIVLQMAGGYLEADITVYTAIARVSTACSIVFLIASSWLTVLCFASLARHGAAGRGYWIVPALLCLSNAVDLTLQGIIMRSYNHIIFYSVSIIGTLLLGVLYSLIFIKIRRNPFASDS